jgi:crossover junction endodeoxyribonuclease RuvC
MTIILGIDPGSRITGYGIIKVEGSRQHYLSSGCVRVEQKSHANRLKQIFLDLQEVIQTYQPDEASIEQIFFHRNPATALKLGQARGVAMAVTALAEISITEYSARQIKQSVVGYGAAKKDQVQHMVCKLLNLTGQPQADAADALAVALCHATSRKNFLKLNEQSNNTLVQRRFRRGRMR